MRFSSRGCQEGKSHFRVQRPWDNPAVPRTRALPRGARRCHPPVQVALETFCSSAVNSRGSLRTEIRPAPGPGLAASPLPARAVPGLSPGCPRCHPCCPRFGGLCCRSPSAGGEQWCPAVPALSPPAAALGGLRCGDPPGGFGVLERVLAAGTAWGGLNGIWGGLNGICFKKQVMCQKCLLCAVTVGQVTQTVMSAEDTS